MAFIGFGKIDKNIIALILGCVFCILNRLLNSLCKTELFNNVVLTNIFISFANTLIIIPFIVYRIISKKNDKNIKNEDLNINDENKDLGEIKKIEYIYNGNDYNEDLPGKIKYTIFIALIFFANYYLFICTIKIKSNTWIIYIVFSPIFYFMIFKSKLYRHHYLSICLILIFGIIIDVVEGNFKRDVQKFLLEFFLSFLRVILLSFDYVLIKFTMEKKCVSPYLLGMFNGLINLVLFIIFFILDYYFFKIYEYSKYFRNFNTRELLILLGLMITQLGLYTSLFFIDKNDSPCHIFIVFVFGQFGYIFSNLKSIADGGKIAVIIICLILILFFSLVFNEIIELRFFGFAFNTKRNIIERSETEANVAMILNNQTEDSSQDSMESSNKSVENN